MPSFFPRRTFLLGVEFQASNSPPVSTWAVCHCLLPRWFLMRNCCHSSCFPFHVRCFFLLTFTIFCFVSSFQRVWLWSVLAWISLDLSQCSLIFLNMGVYVSVVFFFFCQICKVSSHHFFESIFRPFLFLLFFQNLSDMNDRFCCCCYGLPGAGHQSCFFFFLSLFCLYCLYWVISVVLISRFTDSFLCYPHSAVEAAQWVLICIFICHSLLRLSVFFHVFNVLIETVLR